MKYIHVRSVNGTSYSGDYTLLSFREKKDLSLEDLAGPVKMMAIPQHGPQKKNLTKVYNYGQKLSKRFTQADYSNNKAHTLAIKLAIYSDIF